MSAQRLYLIVGTVVSFLILEGTNLGLLFLKSIAECKCPSLVNSSNYGISVKGVISRANQIYIGNAAQVNFCDFCGFQHPHTEKLPDANEKFANNLYLTISQSPKQKRSALDNSFIILEPVADHSKIFSNWFQD